MIRIVLFFLFGCIHSTLSQNYEVSERYIKYKDQRYINGPVFVDSKGAIWYGTPNGLIKDYVTEQVFIPFEFSSAIFSIKEDFDGNIWVASGFGCYKVNPNTFEVNLIRWRTSVKSEYENFTDILVDGLGNVWGITGVGNVLKYNLDNTFKLIGVIENKVLSHNTLYLNNSGEIIILNEETLQKGLKLNLYKFSDGKIQPIKINDFEGAIYSLLNTTPINSVLKEEGTYFFRGTEYSYKYLHEIGMYIVERGTYSSEKMYIITEDDEIVFHTDKDLIIAKFKTNEKGLTLTPLKSVKEKSATHGTFYDIFSQNIIVGYSHKIVIIRKKKQKFTRPDFMKKLPRISTRGMIMGPNNELFIASYQGNYVVNLANNQVRNLNNISNKAVGWIHDMELERHKIWATKQFNGLYEIDTETKNIRSYSIPDNDISEWSIVLKPLDEKKYWLGTTQGIYIFNKESKKFKPYDKLNKHINLSGQFIKDLLYDKQNNVLWIANQDLGVVKYSIEEDRIDVFQEDSKNNKILSNRSEVIHQDEVGNIWIGTKNGINKITPEGKIESFNLESGISNNHIISILETKQYLWFGTFNGITCLDKKSEKFFNIFVSELINENEFNHSSALKVNDSLLYFGGVNGVYQFSENMLNNKSHIQELIPLSLERYNVKTQKSYKKYDLKNFKQLHLTHDNNSFELELGLTHSFKPEYNHYQYFIKGLMPEWETIENSNIIKVFGIPPGNYTLMVKAKNEEGRLAANELILPIHVSEVFYKKTIFILISGVLLGVILFLIVRGYYKKKQYRDKVTHELRQLELRALRGQLNPHFIFNVINGLQLDLMTKGEEEINEHIHSFSKLIRTTMEMVTNDKIFLSNEIDYLTAYIKLQKNRLDGNLDYLIILPKTELLNSIEIPCMLIQPVVENAIIHGLEPKTADRSLKLEFSVNGEYLYVSIIDNGIGREEAAKKRNSLNRVHALNIVQKRIDLRAKGHRKKVEMKITDLYEKGVSFGTKVDFKIKI